ncbi:hemolysin III family channel protein [Corynebacterium tuberculostearicum]|uniref:hemolysin III family channel protein n=1 Tax=Corynebacterium tuberculostearicum TaxID=38304 RepID=UPI0025F1AF00|nr:hemolysin III family channel protein [Corynebacterium tuberculostearicum]
MPQQSTLGPIATITFLVLGIISSVIAILMVPALFHEATSLRAAVLTGSFIFGIGMLVLFRRCAKYQRK